MLYWSQLRYLWCAHHRTLSTMDAAELRKQLRAGVKAALKAAGAAKAEAIGAVAQLTQEATFEEAVDSETAKAVLKVLADEAVGTRDHGVHAAVESVRRHNEHRHVKQRLAASPSVAQASAAVVISRACRSSQQSHPSSAPRSP